MREQALRFGSSSRLVGILSEPDPNLKLASGPGVLMWNVGIHHHIGPNRIFVDLARAMAGCGFTCLRFDVSGLGDSEAGGIEAASDKERAAGDIRAAMQVITERTRIAQFLLIAFCSGTDAAHALTTSDPRVVGVVYIEGYNYKTPGFYARYLKRYIDAARWERLLKFRFPQFLPPEMRELVATTGSSAPVFAREYVGLEQFRQDMRSMVSRGTKFLFLYAGRDGTYAYRAQLQDAIADLEVSHALDVERYSEADHMFFLEEDRDKVISDISRWANRRFVSANDSVR